MTSEEDPRLAATRARALEAALDQLQEQGVLAVTHATVGARSGISRSTLYRHWPTLDELLDSTFRHAITAQVIPPQPNGPLRADLYWLLRPLRVALTETRWGKIAPQVIAAASSDDRAKRLINTFVAARYEVVRSVFEAARSRGELSESANIGSLIELTVAAPYFRMLIARQPLDDDWLDSHVEQILRLATAE